MQYRRNRFSETDFAGNSEAFASELLENLEATFPCYWQCSTQTNDYIEFVIANIKAIAS